MLRKALFFSFSSKYTSMMIDFIAVMVISRLLSPSDIGLFSIAAGSIAIGQMMRDFGLSLYLVQEKNLTEEKIRGSFTISLILCWSIAIIYFFSAPYVAVFFENESLKLLLRILAVNFLLIPFGTFTLSLLKREMKFNQLMLIDVSSTLLRTTLCIILAYLSFGAISLAYASVLGTLVTVILTFPYTKRSHFKLYFTNIKSIAQFSSVVSASNLLHELKEILPEFFIGKTISTEAVAFYSKAGSTTGIFSKLVLSAISPTIQPYLAQLDRKKISLETPVVTTINYIQVCSFPFFVFLFYFSDSVIYYLYGDQWHLAAPLLRLCCISSIIFSIFPLAEQMLDASGHTRYVLKFSSFLFSLRLVFLIIFVVFQLEISQLLMLFIIVEVIRVLFLMKKFRAAFNLKIIHYSKCFLLNMSITLALYFSFITLTHFLNEKNLHEFLIIMMITGLLWLGLLLISTHPLSNEIKRFLPLKK